LAGLSDQQVNQVAQEIIASLRGEGKSVSVQSHPSTPATGSPVSGFSDLDSAVSAAATAQVELMKLTLEKRGEIISSIRAKMMQNLERLSRHAHEETGYGRYAHKIEKNRVVTQKTPGLEGLNPTAYSGDRGLTLVEPAPYGVIGAITPVTNPTSTIICNTIGMVAAGNGVVFNPHPSAKMCSLETIRLINEAIVEAGGPSNLITSVAEPTIQTASALMKHKGIRLLVVTGGAGVVKAAMASGKRAICAGPGNPPVVVDETANLDQAARDIIIGASMDNNIICVDEKEVFVVEHVADILIRKLQEHGAFLVPEMWHKKLESFIFAEQKGPRKPAVMNKDCIGKNATDILLKAGITTNGKEPELAFMVVGEDHPLVWSEQMMPILPVVRVKDADTAIRLAKEAEHGFGHSAIMHSRNIDNLSQMAKLMNTSIFVKNGPAVAGLGYGGEAFCSFTIASPTGEGLTGPRSFSRERRCVLVDHFRIV
jgi:propionaldehyde dehydrogenase